MMCNLSPESGAVSSQNAFLQHQDESICKISAAPDHGSKSCAGEMRCEVRSTGCNGSEARHWARSALVAPLRLRGGGCGSSKAAGASEGGDSGVLGSSTRDRAPVQLGGKGGDGADEVSRSDAVPAAAPASADRADATGVEKTEAASASAGEVDVQMEAKELTGPAPPAATSMPTSENVELVLVTPQNAEATGVPDMKSPAWTAAKDNLDKTLKAFAPLDLRALPDEIQRALAYIRAKGKETGVVPSKEMGHDVRLLRFLIGQKWDAMLAGKEYADALKKRKQLSIDTELRDKIVGANAAFFGGGASLEALNFHPASAKSAELMPRIWVDPRSGPPFTLLTNRTGHVVVIDQAPDFNQIKAVGPEAWNDAELAFTELQMLVLDELSCRSGNLIMACKVTDVSKRETALVKSLLPNPMAPASEKQFKTTGALMKSLYPTVVFKWFMLNLHPSYKGKVESAIAYAARPQRLTPPSPDPLQGQRRAGDSVCRPPWPGRRRRAPPLPPVGNARQRETRFTRYAPHALPRPL